MPATLLVVDGANVVGSVPDGWWRDRAGAAERLRDRLVSVAVNGLPGLPPPVEVIMVVEGAAKSISGLLDVRVVPAAEAGDDTLVDVVRAAGAIREVVVVTADRQLRDRVTALGARVIGPATLRAG